MKFFFSTHRFFWSLFISLQICVNGYAQEFSFVFDPSSLELEIGEVADLTIELLDTDGNNVEQPFIVFISGRDARRALTLSQRNSMDGGSLDTQVQAHKSGNYELIARTLSGPEFDDEDEDQFQAAIPIAVSFPPLERITLSYQGDLMYTGTTISIESEVYDAANMLRNEMEVRMLSSDNDVASFDEFGNLTAHSPGTINITAHVDNVRENAEIHVVENPLQSLVLKNDVVEARTGDVLQFSAVAMDGNNNPIDDAPVMYTFSGKPIEKLGKTPAGEIAEDGRFVAETPGFYTIIASSGNFQDRRTVKIVQRSYNQKLEIVSHGAVEEVYTSDLWVWEGIDGRDYVVTGTWGANGEAYFWDVTDPSNMVLIDTVTVDARTVNDVKVSEDARIAVISREGASNRKNGLVILDVSDPYNVEIISRFDDGLTGGVHNVFIYQDYVYAVNNGVRYDIINIKDPKNPFRVGSFELDTPGHSVHDVWIEKGIAYSSNWHDGVQLVNVGGSLEESPLSDIQHTLGPEFSSPTKMAGSPENPVQFASYQYPSGWNHAAFPFRSQSTDKFYVLAGDETFPTGLGVRNDIPMPTIADGWIHFIDFSNLSKPKEEAYYRVAEAGSHNFWVDGDLLYAAFYNGGFRVVDMSGDLMGDLYNQGREVARFYPMHHKGIIPNAPMVWGPMPHKGIIYFTDHNSGLWAVRLVQREPIAMKGID